MKLTPILATLTLLSSFSVLAQYHNDIAPIRGARDEAKALIKTFQLQNQNLDSGAPEYSKIYNERFVPSIKVETDKLEASLDAINQALSKDYSLIMSLKGKKQTTALKETIKIAEKRLDSAANDMLREYYHNPIRSVVTLDNSFSKNVKYCLTVLCVNQLKEDYVKWIKLSSTLNKKLDLETTAMDKIQDFNKFTKSALNLIEDEAGEASLNLAVSLTKEEYENILRAREQAIEDARIQAEIEAKKEKFGCEELTFASGDIYLCESPYVIKNGEKINISSASFSDEKYKNICASVKMKSTVETVPWKLNFWENVIDSSFVKTLICVESVKKLHKDRLTSEKKLLMEDGKTHIYLPGYEFEDRWASITAKAPNETCQFFGLSKAVEQENWQKKSNPYFGPNLIIISKTQVKLVSEEKIWAKIICE